MAKLFNVPDREKMIEKILKHFERTYENSEWLQEQFPDKEAFLKRIKENIEKYNETELIRAYYQTMPSFV